jgi:UDP-N-acetylmuramyl pentapeptide synthase
MPAIAKRLQSFAPPERTFQVRQERGVTVLDDTYNSSPASVAAAVEWARQQPAKRKVLVTSGIIELGEAEEKLHREIAVQAQAVFAHAYVLGRKFLPYFRDGGFGKRASSLPSSPPRLQADDLLVCVGRMPQSVIDRLLPDA